MMQAQLQRFALLIVLLQCLRRSHSVRTSTPLVETKLAKDIRDDSPVEQRRVKKTKSIKGSDDEERAYSPVAWSPAMSPAEWSDLYYGRDPPTIEETAEPTPWPSVDLLSSENVFDLSPKDSPATDEQESKDENASTDDASLGLPQHVVAKVSVAVTRSISPSNIRQQVSKVTTKVIRSYTEFVVYMLDGSRRTRRDLQTTRLEYDPKFSSVSLAAHGVEVSWWTFHVAYKVTTGVEEREESNEIDELTTNAVDGAILSGLFQQLLSQVSSEVVGVSIPGREMNQPILDAPKNPPKGTAAQPSEDADDQRNRGAGIGLAVLCFAVMFSMVAIFVIARRRRKRSVEEVWTIPLGEQKETGRILNAEWDNAYLGERPGASENQGAFTLAPRDPPGSYMLDTWEYGTYDGTADGTDEITNLSFDSTNLSLNSNGSLA